MYVYKYDLPVSDRVSLFLPRGSTLLRVQEVQRSLFVWALVDPTEPDEERVFEVVGTGHPVDPVAPLERKFVGTSVGHPFVWHVFELVQPTTL